MDDDGLQFGSHDGSPAIIQQARTTTAAFFLTHPLTCPCRFARPVPRGHLGAEGEHAVVGCPFVCACTLAKPPPLAVLSSRSPSRASILCSAICSPSCSTSCSGSPSKLHKHLVPVGHECSLLGSCSVPFWYASWRSVDPATIRSSGISLELVATVAPALPVHVTRPFRTMRGYDLVADLTNAL